MSVINKIVGSFDYRNKQRKKKKKAIPSAKSLK